MGANTQRSSEVEPPEDASPRLSITFSLIIPLVRDGVHHSKCALELQNCTIVVQVRMTARSRHPLPMLESLGMTLGLPYPRRDNVLGGPCQFGCLHLPQPGTPETPWLPPYDRMWGFVCLVISRRISPAIGAAQRDR